MALVQELIPVAIPQTQVPLGSIRSHSVPLRRFGSTTGCPLSSSVRCHCSEASAARHVAPSPGVSLSARKLMVEKLWREFFLDSSQWWDHRAEKVNPRYPDFRHKKTQQSLWLDNNLTPSWVEVELAAMAPGVLQSNIFSWNTRLQRYAKAGEYKKTMELFQEMEREGVTPNQFTFVPVLKACSALQSLDAGRSIHSQIIQTGQSDVYVANCLVDMYARCGSIEDAWRVFKEMPSRNVVSWNIMILGYVKCGDARKAVELSGQMYQQGLEPSPVTFVGVLNACASVGALEEGRLVEEQIIRRGYDSNVFVVNSLVDMYAKCGRIEDARRVFNKMPSHDVASWNTVILGHVRCGEGQTALELSRQMYAEGVQPDPTTFVGLLNASASVGALEQGKLVHEQIISRGYQSNVFVGSSLVDMYAKCGSIEEARRLFNEMPVRNVVSWTAMILGYVKCGEGQAALELSRQMHAEGVEPDPTSFVGLLSACASVGTLEVGRLVHELIILRGYQYDIFVGNSLVDMYAKCGSVEDARRVFDKMPSRNVVSWNAMILGYVKCGEWQKALELCRKMPAEGVEPDTTTFVGMLNACAGIAGLEEGRLVHEQIILRGYECDVFVASSLVDMYGKCGSMEDAQTVFSKMHTRNVVVWNAMLAGYAMHGKVKEALHHFERMCQEVDLDDVTFIHLLSACSHGGLVEEGLYYFEAMHEVYNVSPTMAHYACVIDLIGRAGFLHKAEDLIRNMPWKADATVWMSLLAACRIHGNLEVGERVAKQVLELAPEDASGYVLLSNIYSAAGRKDEAAVLQGHCYYNSVQIDPTHCEEAQHSLSCDSI